MNGYSVELVVTPVVLTANGTLVPTGHPISNGRIFVPQVQQMTSDDPIVIEEVFTDAPANEANDIADQQQPHPEPPTDLVMLTHVPNSEFGQGKMENHDCATDNEDSLMLTDAANLDDLDKDEMDNYELGPYSKSFRELQRQLEKIGLVHHNVLPDGNCFFRALAHQLHGTEEGHIEIRRQMVDYIRKNWNTYRSYFFFKGASKQQILKSLAEDGDTEIYVKKVLPKMAAHCFKVQVRKHKLNEKSVTYKRLGNVKDTVVIDVVYHPERDHHYASVKKYSPNMTEPLNTEDHEVAQYVQVATSSSTTTSSSISYSAVKKYSPNVPEPSNTEDHEVAKYVQVATSSTTTTSSSIRLVEGHALHNVLAYCIHGSEDRSADIASDIVDFSFRYPDLYSKIREQCNDDADLISIAVIGIWFRLCFKLHRLHSDHDLQLFVGKADDTCHIIQDSENDFAVILNYSEDFNVNDIGCFSVTEIATPETVNSLDSPETGDDSETAKIELENPPNTLCRNKGIKKNRKNHLLLDDHTLDTTQQSKASQVDSEKNDTRSPVGLIVKINHAAEEKLSRQQGKMQKKSKRGLKRNHNTTQYSKVKQAKLVGVVKKRAEVSAKKSRRINDSIEPEGSKDDEEKMREIVLDKGQCEVCFEQHGNNLVRHRRANHPAKLATLDYENPNKHTCPICWLTSVSHKLCPYHKAARCSTCGKVVRAARHEGCSKLYTDTPEPMVELFVDCPKKRCSVRIPFETPKRPHNGSFVMSKQVQVGSFIVCVTLCM